MSKNVVFFSVLLGILSFFCLSRANAKKYFQLNPSPLLHIRFQEVALFFSLYIFVFMQSGKILGPLLECISVHLSDFFRENVMSLLPVTTYLLLALIFSALCHFIQDSGVKKIWTNSQTSPFDNFWQGIKSLAICFPAVIFTGQILNLFILVFLERSSHTQVAIQYLKDSRQCPLQVAAALFSIVLAAPLFEEFLFRGCLQNYFKRYVGQKAAILLSSLFFASFHFSKTQGNANISIIGSLFVLSCFLGILYEKKGSLVAPIGLHVAFNLVGSLRILFFEG